MIVEFDDLGARHKISEQCRAHDCRDKLDKLHYANLGLKVTLFAIPAEMTQELLDWCKANSSWIQLAVHGFTHSSNWECHQMSYEEFAKNMKFYEPMISEYFIKGFRSPGWQTSADVFTWLADNNWWVSCQSYDINKVPFDLKCYINFNGTFKTIQKGLVSDAVPAYHGHTWDVGQFGNEPNGIYEDYENIESKVRAATEFKFIGELFNA